MDPKFDAQEWAKEIKKARDMVKPSAEEEAEHLAKLQLWTVVLAALGVVMAARGVVSPVAMVLLCLFKEGQFCILAHHSLHGGWGRHRRGSFAKGLKRIVDWVDWILPEAWNAEHNKEHHYKLNECADPDRVDRNTEFVSSLQLPYPLKCGLVFALAATWKWYYYASNTLKLIHARKPNAPKGKEIEGAITVSTLITRAFSTGDKWYMSFMVDFIVRDMGPPFLLQYVAYPLVVSFIRWLGGLPLAFWCVVVNMAGAELLANLQQFATIVTNHAGSDLWTFKDPCGADTPEFYLRSVLGSTAYSSGNDVIDYLHGYLNYQAEHHCFPDLSPLHYQRLHPHFKKICSTYGVPYIQEPVWKRVRKTMDIMVGRERMSQISGQASDQPKLWSKGWGFRPKHRE